MFQTFWSYFGSWDKAIYIYFGRVPPCCSNWPSLAVHIFIQLRFVWCLLHKSQAKMFRLLQGKTSIKRTGCIKVGQNRPAWTSCVCSRQSFPSSRGQCSRAFAWTTKDDTRHRQECIPVETPPANWIEWWWCRIMPKPENFKVTLEILLHEITIEGKLITYLHPQVRTSCNQGITVCCCTVRSYKLHQCIPVEINQHAYEYHPKGSNKNKLRTVLKYQYFTMHQPLSTNKSAGRILHVTTMLQNS